MMIVDVLVITALPKERDAVKCVDNGAVGAWAEHKDSSGFRYEVRDYEASGGARIRVALARAVKMGGDAATEVAARLVAELSPRCLAMCGICAGWPGKVSLGNVIVADRVYRYDDGKIIDGESDARILSDIQTYNLDARWKQAAEDFPKEWATPLLENRPFTLVHQENWVLETLYRRQDGDPLLEHPDRKSECPSWTQVIKRLQGREMVEVGGDGVTLTEAGRQHITRELVLTPDGLPRDRPFKLHVAPIATGSSVIQDGKVFDRLGKAGLRKVLGLEMEAAAIGMVAHIRGVEWMIVAKGICDHADLDKDDAFHRFAARMSAEFLLAFLRRELPAASDKKTDEQGREPPQVSTPLTNGSIVGRMAGFERPPAPPIASTLPAVAIDQQLPFDQLEAGEFAHLCYWLVQAEGFNNIEFTEKSRTNEGVNIVASKDEHLFAFQCRRVARFGPKAAEREIAKLEDVKEPPDEVVFVITRPVTDRTQNHARRAWGSRDTCHFWCGPELERKVKKHQTLLQKFFGTAEPSGPVLAAVERLERKITDGDNNSSGLPADRYVRQVHTNQASGELSRLLKRRSFDLEVARKEVRNLDLRLTNGDVQHADRSVKAEVVAWAARLHATQPETLPDAKLLRDRLLELDSSADTQIIDALILECEGESDEALRILRDVTAPDARTVFLKVLHESKGLSTALEWFDNQKRPIDADFFTGLGWFNLAVMLAKADRWQDAAIYLAAVCHHWNDWPDLAFIEGVVNAALLLPAELRHLTLQMNIYHRDLHTLEGKEVDLHRERATICFKAAETTLKEIHEGRANVAKDWLLWLRLTHSDPETSRQAREEVQEQLKNDIGDMFLVQIAHAFSIPFNAVGLWDYLVRRAKLGGLTDDELRMQCLLAEMRMKPRDFLHFLEKGESRLAMVLSMPYLIFKKIETLVNDGQTVRARKLLEEHKDNLHGDDLRISAMIDEREGLDPRAEFTALYEASNDLLDLKNLAQHLRAVGDWKALRPCLVDLFERERTLRNAARLIHCMQRDLSTKPEEILAFLGANSDLTYREPGLISTHAYLLFQMGKLDESRLRNNKLLEERGGPEDLHLDINLALQLGEWEKFPGIVEREWQKRDQHDSETLMRLSSLAAQTDLTADRAFNLVKLAVSKASDKPHILVNAIELGYRLGREGEDVRNWLGQAHSLSSEKGPVQAVDLRTLVEEWMPAHREQERVINDQILKGSIPLHLAASHLNTPLSRVLIGSVRNNLTEKDGRRRNVIPIVSGARGIAQIDQGDKIGIDSTSLMVLFSLGLLKKALDHFSYTFLAPDTMLMLLNEKTTVRFHQPSRVKAAREILALVDGGQLRTESILPNPPESLKGEVGISFAQILQAAKEEEGYVVTCRPSHKVRSFLSQEADIGDYQALIISTVQLEAALFNRGYLDSETHERVSKYLRAGDSGDESVLESFLLDKPLYIDDLALSYIQSSGALPKIASCGLDLRIHHLLRREQTALVNASLQGEELVEAIEGIRLVLCDAIQQKKVGFIPRVSSTEEGWQARCAPTFLQFAQHSGECNAICVDDRYLNQHAVISDSRGRNVRVLCVLDVLLFLESRGALSSGGREAALHRLRESGFAFIPLDVDSLKHCASLAQWRDGVLVESSELRVVRQSLALIRSLDLLQLPDEEHFLRRLQVATLSQLRQIWVDSGISSDQAWQLSTWIWRYVAPSPLDWSQDAASDSDKPVKSFLSFLHALVVQPLCITDRDRRFRDWMQEVVLSPLLPANSADVDRLAKNVGRQIGVWSTEIAEK